MQLFGRSGGYWLFWGSAVYLTVGLLCTFYFPGTRTEFIQILWLSFLVLPFTYPPLGRWLNMDVKWDKNIMFNWFGKDKESNVIKFPEQRPVPQVEPPKKEEPAKIYYRLGLTDNNRVSFQMGYSEITMNHQGVQNLIDQLKFFQGQLATENEE